jgi:iron complex outermembrane receptor protein
VTKNFTRALCLGAVSYLVLSIDLSSPVLAQSASLPAVTVEAPVRQTARGAAPSRRPSANRAASRRTPSPLRQAEPVPYVTPRTGIIGTLPAAYAGGQVATGGQSACLVTEA